MTGEVGEACNEIKKLNRLRDGLVGNKPEDQDIAAIQAKLAKELADIFGYLDLLATAADIDLEAAIRAKFNEVSDRVGFPEKL